MVSVLGVVVAVSLLVVVTSIGVGLAAGTTIYDTETDYWVVPDSNGAQSPLLSLDGTQFGSVHDTTKRMQAIDGVEAATPVLSQIYRIEAGESGEFVVMVGIINSPELQTVLGVDTTPLSEGDPYYETGRQAGEIVLSSEAANLLAVTSGETVTVRGTEFTVAAVSERSGNPAGNVPTGVVHLSELQAITGADEYDQANQFVVKTRSRGVKSELAGIYPDSSVHSRSEMAVSQTLDSDLSLALALTSFIIAVVIGTLFVVTTMGLEIVADRQTLLTLSAIGVSGRSQLGVISMQVLTTTGIGGVLGGIGGLGAIVLTNRAATWLLTSEPVALFHPLFAVYGIAASFVIGAISLVYLLVLTKRVSRGVPTR